MLQNIFFSSILVIIITFNVISMEKNDKKDEINPYELYNMSEPDFKKLEVNTIAVLTNELIEKKLEFLISKSESLKQENKSKDIDLFEEAKKDEETKRAIKYLNISLHRLTSMLSSLEGRTFHWAVSPDSYDSEHDKTGKELTEEESKVKKAFILSSSSLRAVKSFLFTHKITNLPSIDDVKKLKNLIEYLSEKKLFNSSDLNEN